MKPFPVRVVSRFQSARMGLAAVLPQEPLGWTLADYSEERDSPI